MELSKKNEPNLSKKASSKKKNKQSNKQVPQKQHQYQHQDQQKQQQQQQQHENYYHAVDQQGQCHWQYQSSYPNYNSDPRVLERQGQWQQQSSYSNYNSDAHYFYQPQHQTQDFNQYHYPHFGGLPQIRYHNNTDNPVGTDEINHYRLEVDDFDVECRNRNAAQVEVSVNSLIPGGDLTNQILFYTLRVDAILSKHQRRIMKL